MPRTANPPRRPHWALAGFLHAWGWVAMVWIGLLAAGAVLEARAIRRHRGTLTEALARAARCDTVAGRVAFAGGTMLGAAWLAGHVTEYGRVCLSAPVRDA